MESCILRVSCKVYVSPFSLTLQESRSMHDSMNIQTLNSFLNKTFSKAPFVVGFFSVTVYCISEVVTLNIEITSLFRLKRKVLASMVIVRHAQWCSA